MFLYLNVLSYLNILQQKFYIHSQVDEDDVEKANPPSFDKVEDLAQLRFLNESSVLHTLRQRFGNQLTHTFAGPTIISINPMAPLAIYSEKVIQVIIYK